MRKILTFILILILCQLFIVNAVFACDMNITPDDFEVKSGDVVNFTLERQVTHRRCVLPLEDTQIKVQGGEVKNISSWVEGNPDVLEFQVKFLESGAARVEVVRDCPKGLQLAEVQGNVIDSNGTDSKITSFNENNKNAIVGNVIDSNGTDSKITSFNENNKNAIVGNVSRGKYNADGKQKNKKKNNRQFQQNNNMNYWYIFILGGLILYLLRLTKIRKIWLFFCIAVLGFYLGGCPCPIGQVFRAFLGDFTLLLAIPLIIALIWGRVFCGWVCPIGGTQELINIKKLSIKIPNRLDSKIKLLKYIILILFVILTIICGKNMWGQCDPFKVLFNFSGTNLTIGILFVTLIASVFIERFFCRYICPLGAILEVLSRFAIFKIGLDKNKCCTCKTCTTGICPMDAIKVKKGEQYPEIDSKECIRCRKCVDVCKRKAIN